MHFVSVGAICCANQSSFQPVHEAKKNAANNLINWQFISSVFLHCFNLMFNFYEDFVRLIKATIAKTKIKLFSD